METNQKEVKNILVVTDGIYPFVMGGMQKHSYYLAKFLARCQIDLTLYHCKLSNEDIVNQGADSDHFSAQELEHITFHCLQFPSAGKLPGHYLRKNKIYSSMVFEHSKASLDQFDIIYAQGFTGWSFIKNKANIKPPIIINFHGYEMFQKAPSKYVLLQHLLLRPAAKWMSKNADYTTSLGGKLTDILRKIGVKEKKILETPIGLEKSWLNPESLILLSEGQRKFVFIGRYERRKGIEELNEALKGILDSGKLNFEFHFIGPIPENKQINSEQLIYHGRIDNPQNIQSILRSSDILVCPSHSEGMPTVILEGMASGLAIIATNVGAVSKQVSDNGWIINDNEPSTITKALEQSCKISSAELIEMKFNSMKRIQSNFLWNQVVKITLAQFNKIINKSS